MFNAKNTTAVLDEVLNERIYQYGKWSDNYDDKGWTEDEWAHFILEYLPSSENSVSLRHPDYEFRKNMLKVAALAVAAIEAHDAKNAINSVQLN